MNPARLSLLLLAAAGAAPALAQDTRPSTDQVIVPQVQRRDIQPAHYPSRDFSFGVFGGVLGTQNFGASSVGGVRLGYHVTEDVFVEGSWGRSKVSDESFRQILPGGIFVDRSETLTYYNVSAGYNILTGEAFFGRNNARATQGYLLAGVGSTTLAGQKHQTISVGLGMRLILGDRFALQADMRDHVFALDLLGKRETTHNLEATLGVSVYF
jgi:outer membrane beta-barrel protein